MTDIPTDRLADATASLELAGIRKCYGDFVAVDEVSLAVPTGTIFGLLGPNGAGKTTTLRMIMDIIAPDSGEVLLFGHSRTRDDLSRVGYLPEERGLYRRMTVTDHLVFFAELRGIQRREALPEIGSWLERVGLSEWAKKKIEELSKGMQQKIQLVATVLHDPELLILDEPFSGLDPINQSLFKDMLLDYRSQGRTVVLSTHVMEQAEKLCDHIGLISHGRVILEGKLAELRRERGGNSYRVEARGDLEGLAELPGVLQSVTRDGTAKLLLEPDADGSEVLREIVARWPVRAFRTEEPDLETLFLEAVRRAGD